MPGIGIGIGINNRRVIGKPAAPTGLSASFTVDTISGDLSWTDNSGGKAQYEVYSSTNGGAYTLLTTTAVGATSYSDTTCKQNASVEYRIRGKKGSVYSKYATTSVINTPLCLKTNQTTRTEIKINTMNIAAGKTVNIDFGDGTNTNYTGDNTDIVHTYADSATNTFNLKFSGDTLSITKLRILSQTVILGDISNWIFSSNTVVLTNLNISGDISNIPNYSPSVFNINNTLVSGKCPNISANAYNLYNNLLTGSNLINFKVTSTVYDIKNQGVVFPTSEIDKFFKAAADWYQVNAPTANCTFNLSGANMGIPTDGVSNVDIVRLSGYYTAADKSATILVRTS